MRESSHSHALLSTVAGGLEDVVGAADQRRSRLDLARQLARPPQRRPEVRLGLGLDPRPRSIAASSSAARERPPTGRCRYSGA